MAQLTSQVGLPLKNILVVTDFSAASLAALNCTVSVAKESGCVIHLLHVIRPEIENALSHADDNVKLQIENDAQRQLGALETVIATAPHKMWLHEGSLWRSIEDLARSEHFDLIVVGTSSQSDFMGSGAEEVIRKALCPVMIVGPRASTPDHAPLAQLLYVANLWDGSHAGLEYAIQLAIRYRSRLLLLHVVEQEESKQSDHEWLKAFRRIMRNLLPESVANLAEDPVLRVEVARNISARILQVADEVRTDLIVMDVAPEQAGATQSCKKLYEVISQASCPVLTVQRMTSDPARG
jgi:nucleotide-binding universal stress UspA family protein